MLQSKRAHGGQNKNGGMLFGLIALTTIALWLVGCPTESPESPDLTPVSARRRSPKWFLFWEQPPRQTYQRQPVVINRSATTASHWTGGGTLPTWISFDKDNRTLTITTAAVGNANLTYQVTDADGDSVSLDFTVAVEADIDPTFGTTTTVDLPLDATAGMAFSSQQLPEASGGNGTLVYTLVPADSSDANAFPAGLTPLPPTTRTISGTPTAGTVPAGAMLTYTATDADGDTDRADGYDRGCVDLTRRPLRVMEIDAQTYAHRAGDPAMDPADGDGGQRNTDLPDRRDIPTGLTTVPADLSGGSSTPIAIGGTPTTAAGAPTLTYTVTDADGNTA